MTLQTAYDEHADLLFILAGLTTKRLNLDYDEALSLTYEIFVESCLTWDGRSPLGKRIRYCVWNRTLDELDRRTAKRRGGGRIIESLEGRKRFDYEGESDEEEGVATPIRFDLRRFLLELSEDAKDVVALALDLPPPRTKRTGEVVRTDVVEALSGAGWAAERIRETFQEIAEALQ